MNRYDKSYTFHSWDDAKLFLAVVEYKSFSGAAKALRLGQPTISRRIRALEQSLGQPLFVRSKFGAEATSQAKRLIPVAEQMAKCAIEFARTASGEEQEVEGQVTIAAPPGIVAELLAPFAMTLREQEPNIRLAVLASIEHIDLARGGADIAIRTQPPTDPNLVALHRFESQMAVLASVDYASALEQPCEASDLDWVSWAGQFKSLAPRPQLEKLITDFDPVFASDDYLTQMAAVDSGIGAIICARPLQIQKSKLVEIDIGVSLPSLSFYIVCAKSMQHVPRVMAVVKRLTSALI
jgi:DNA-binding transcriptional LysR family regulator